MTKWKKPSEELIVLLKDTLCDVDYEPRKMFGQFACFMKGHMFSGVFQNEIFLRLSEEDRVSLQNESDEVSHFEPREGMRMKEYVVIPENYHSNSETLKELIMKSIEYTLSLPPKRKNA